MSARGGKADMLFCVANVRLWPKADIGPPQCWFRRRQEHDPPITDGHEPEPPITIPACRIGPFWRVSDALLAKG